MNTSNDQIRNPENNTSKLIPKSFLQVIVLLTSDTSELKEPEKVRASQEKALQALQQYTIARYPEMPAKFGELLLRIPDLQRTCQAGKELLSAKRAEGEGCSFNLLMELLRGDH